jgi:hypothetical protein
MGKISKKILRLSLILIITLFVSFPAFSQFGKFSLFGGPMIGWHIPNVDDLNTQLRTSGLPELNTDGYFTIGGGGYMDVPKLDGLRIGGLGTGFSTETSIVTSGDITKRVNYKIGYGGVSFEYVHSMGDIIELTGGATLATGELVIDIYQYKNGSTSWTQNWNELTNTSSSQNISRQMALRFYSATPKVGIGIFLRSYLYAKINAGYMLSANSGWTGETGEEINDAPSGIKADGLVFDFSLNFGLFFK